MTIKKNFHETISTLLATKLEKDYANKSVNAEISQAIYVDLFEIIANVFSESKAPLDNEAVNYIAQQYYDAILINKKHELDPNVFNQRASLKNIPTKQLVFIAMLFRDTDFKFPVFEEIKKRS